MPGPYLPVPLVFPCTININDELIFLFGQEMQTDVKPATLLHTFMFNTHTNIWTNLTEGFPCQKYSWQVEKHTCSYLRPRKSVVLSIDYCIPILNLTLFPVSWTWTQMEAPVNRGIVFNTNEVQDHVIFIGNNGSDQSQIYAVSCSTKQKKTYL